MKKFRLSILFLFGSILLINSFSRLENRVSGESFADRAGEPNRRQLNFRPEFPVPTNYTDKAAQILENDAARPLSIASADFDEDGMPDLIAGLANGGRGLISFHRGNAALLFPSSEQQKEIDAGKNPLAPFHPAARAVEIPVAPDFVAAGDFDADGHADLIAAQRGDNAVYLLAGDGRGAFSSPLVKELAGAITALAAGDLNRRDGLTDLAIGILGERAQALVLESPDGAFRAGPEAIDLPHRAEDIALGQFDENSEIDVAIGGGRNLTVVSGRDRRLSLDQESRAKIAAAKITRLDFQFEIKAVSALECGTRSGLCEMALLDASGVVHFLKKLKEKDDDPEFSETVSLRVPFGQPLERPAMVPARVSGNPTEQLLVFDRSNQQIHVVFNEPAAGGQNPASRLESFALRTESAPAALLPMRLNKDALSDLVILRAGENAPTVMLTAPQAVFTVNSSGGEPDMNLEDAICLTSSGTCTFRAAREQANYCPPTGPNPCGRVDEIRFGFAGSGPFVIDWYPVNMNMTVTIDGYTQPGATPNTLPNGDDAVLKIQITGPGGGIGSAVVFNGSTSVVRGIAFSNFCGRAAVSLAGTGNHIVEGNFTGTDTAGTAHVGCDGSQGVHLTSSGNTIGGTLPQARNLLTDNGLGVDFFGGSNTLVQGNFIGTDRTATQPLGGGGIGVSINPGANNTIGAVLPGARNVISGHNLAAGTGIQVQGVSANLIQGNFIGLDVTGARALTNNGVGIITTAPNLTVGGTTPAARNIISANGTDGVQINASNGLVQGNFIGTDSTGVIIDPDGISGNADDLGNRRYGVVTCDGPSCGDVMNITVGGLVAGARNVISGNYADGVTLGNAASNAGHHVQGNYIGTDVSGTLPRGNRANGVFDASMGSTIGGNQAGAGNVISANLANGVQIGPFRNSIVRGNFIGLQRDGVSALGNGQHGVNAFGTFGAIVGGTGTSDGNRIAYNGLDGVRVTGFGRQAAIYGNSIFSNGQLGIELIDSANNNQAAPTTTLVSLNNGNATINGTLTGAPNTLFRIEFFANHVCDSSGSGEGLTLIGATNATTNASGVASFAPTFPYSVQSGNFLTATATDPNGNTSKFSSCFRTAAKSFDFEGDGQTDVSIYRPSGGEWWFLRSSNGSPGALQFGSSSDRIVPADYTGDGKTDFAFFRPSTGEWFILRSENFSFYAFPFGASGDVPVPGDYDGDAKFDAAVFRPSTLTWFILRSSGGTSIIQFGASGDQPVVADYDGDGRTDIAIFRPSLGQWWYTRSSDGETRALQFGTSADKPIAADFSGDGRAEIVFWRPATGEWYVLRSEDGSFYAFPFGANGDIPTPGDYDGDGRADAAVWRPSNTNWYQLRSTGGFFAVQFGAAGDRPVPSAFIP